MGNPESRTRRSAGMTRSSVWASPPGPRVRWLPLLVVLALVLPLGGGGSEPALAQLPQSEPASLERVGALDFEPGEQLFTGGVLDSEGTYAYFSTWTRPCRVMKVDLATFERVDAISLDPEGGRCKGAAVIDPDDAYAYVGADRGWVFKIDLATFEQVDALVVDPDDLQGGKHFLRALMDPQGRFAYFGTAIHRHAKIYKIDLETFEWVDTVVLPEDTKGAFAAVIDPEGKYAYFGTEQRPAKVYKVDLETFERVDTITLELENEENWLYAAVIDSEGRYAYFGTRFNEVVNKPARVIKIDLETFERVDAIEMLDVEHESSLYAAVIDPSDTYAYFIGDGTGIPGSPPRVIKVDLRTFERVGAIEIDVMDYNLSAPLMDPGGAFAYVGTYTQPAAHVVKVDLAAFEWVDTIRGTLPEDLLGTAVVDPGGDYAYFGTGQGAPSQVVKVDLDTFERVGSVALEDPEGTLNTEEFDSDRVGGLRSGVIDPQGTYGYFGSVTNRGQVAKVNLETLELVDYIWLEEGEGWIGAAVIDPQGRYAYFGTGTDPARVVKIDLATFERVDALTLEAREYGDAAVIDPEGAYAYFLGGSNSNRLVKVDLETFERVGAILISTRCVVPSCLVRSDGDTTIGITRSIVIDPDGAFAYIGASSSNRGRNVAKVDLETFEWVDTLQLDVEELEFQANSAVMDPEGRFAVFGAGLSGSTNTPGALVSVDLETFEQADTLVLEREFEEAFSGGGGAAGALSAVIDPRGGMAYFGMWSTPGRVVKVRVGRPTGEPTPTPGGRGSYPEAPDDPYFGVESSDPLAFQPTQWALRKIQAPQAWQQLRGTGFGIRVAVLDSGVDLQHEDLQCAGKLDVGPGSDVVANDSNPDDKDGHGTHVAGIIGACTDNGTGVAGVAPDSTLVPVRVLNAAGGGTDAQLIAGLDKAVELGVHVVNMSLGYVPGKEIINNVSAIDAAIGRARDAGIVVVAAAGNDSFPLCEYPALAEDVICVGATDPRDVKSVYSVFPNKTDSEDTIGPGLVAPGGTGTPFCNTYSENILSTIPLEFDTNGCTDVQGYANKFGTSMAAPHVAGVAALVYDRLGGDRSEAAAAQVIAAIIEGADDLGAPGYDPVFGWGRLNASKAVQAVTPAPEPTATATPTVSPTPSESGSASPSPTESPQPDITDVSFTDNTAESGQHSDETLFEAQLTDSGGEPIEGRELTFELRGSESTRSFTATTNEDGIALVTPRLEEKPGPHWLTVRFAGDEEHAGDADTASFFVEKEESALELSVLGENDNKRLRALLSDLDTSSAGITERTIDFYSDGELIGSAATDGGGVASVALPPRHRGNNRTYEAIFEGDEFYLGASDDRPGKAKGGNGGNGGGNGGGRDASASYGGRVLLM